MSNIIIEHKVRQESRKRSMI